MYLRSLAVMVGLAVSVASWAEITIGVDSLSVVHKDSGGAIIAFPDVCKTPAPGGPIPIPYPGVAQGSGGSNEAKPARKAAAKNPTIGSSRRQSSSLATASTRDAVLHALEVKTGGEVHIRQTAGRDSVTTATYVDGAGKKLPLREHALIKLANGELCAICATKDGKVKAVYRLLPDGQQRSAL